MTHQSVYLRDSIMRNQNVQPTTAMKDRVIMITGANSGIGKASSLALAKMGATVVMVARNQEKGEDARSEIIKERSEEHTSELQSHSDLVCRLLLEKKKKTKNT